MPFQRLNSAPIIEAVIDLDCELAPTLTTEELSAGASNAYLGDYPSKQDRGTFEATIRPKESEIDFSGSSQIQGSQFTSKDTLQTLQARRNGFTFNRLAPYTSLDDYFPEVRLRWEQYLKFAKPVVLTGIKLRYLNRIEIPLAETIDLTEYFALLPDELPFKKARVAGLFQSYQMISEDGASVYQVTIATQDAHDAVLPVVLDLCVSSPQNIPPRPFDELQDKVECLRSAKNELFFQSLTPKCLSLFQ